jgi:hypothetical protein
MALPIPTMAIEISHFLIKTGRRKIPPMLGHFALSLVVNNSGERGRKLVFLLQDSKVLIRGIC